MFELNIFIKEFENQKFNFCNANWWPLIKVQVAYQLHLKNAGTFKKSEVNKEYNNKIIKLTFKERLKYHLHFFKSNAPVENLIVTDFCKVSVSDDKSKKLDNPYTDPFLYYFDKYGINYTVYHTGVDTKLFGLELRILSKVYYQKVLEEFEKDLIFKSQLKIITHFLTETYGEDFELYNHLVRNVLSNQVSYLSFLFILKKLKVKNILLYCYYNNTMMSIIRAANQLNITTIEYQHSQVTSNHLAYSNWNIKQHGNQDFFPSKIWVWREKDATYLANQFKNIKNIDFIIGGNLSLFMSNVNRVKKEDSKIKVLVTLQGKGIPEYIIKQLEVQSNLILYLRLHPRYPQDKEFCEMLKLKYEGQIELELSNALPLYELFKQVDYHLTNFSGSAIEAEYFNLTNIIYGEKGYETFKDKIDTKEYLFIDNQKDFSLILKNKLNGVFDLHEMKKDLKDIFLTNFS
jgi:hypothetical protein